MALVGAAHGQGGVHVHVVAGQVEGDQALEEDGPARPGGAEEDQQTGGGAAVGDHVEHGAEGGGLVVDAGSVAVEPVEQAGDAVQGRACPGVKGHVVERRRCEDNPDVSYPVSIYSI